MTETSKNQGFYAKVHEVAIQCMTEGVITSSALGLYVFLVSQSKTFNISKAWVCKNGVSKSTLHRLEKQLVDAGLLRVNPGKGGRRSTIYIPVRYADIENGDMPLGSYCSNMARFKSIPYQNGTATVPKSTGVPYQNGTLLIITNNILTYNTSLTLLDRREMIKSLFWFSPITGRSEKFLNQILKLTGPYIERVLEKVIEKNPDEIFPIRLTQAKTDIILKAIPEILNELDPEDYKKCLPGDL